MRRLLLAYAGTVVLAGAAVPLAAVAQTPAGAPQDWPTAASHTIVPGVSIGGLKLGQSYADMTKIWGSGSSCGAFDAGSVAAGGTPIDRSNFTGVCYWADPGLGAGAAQVNFHAGAIDVIDLEAATTKSGAPTASGAIGKYTVTKGKKKFHVGSPVKDFEKAFPKYTIANDNVIQVAKGKQALLLGYSHGKISSMSLLYPGEF